MNFENAKKGIGQIFTAEILQIITIVLLVITAIAGVLALGALDAESEGVFLGSGIVTLVAGLGGTVISIIAFILNLLGVNNASKDEESFKSAMMWIIIGIIAALVGGFVTTVPVLPDVLKILVNVTELLVMYYVLMGCKNLALKIRNTEVAESADKIWKLIMVTYIITIIVMIIGLIISLVSAGVAGVIIAVLSIVASVIEVIAYIMYLMMLSKAKNMF